MAEAPKGGKIVSESKDDIFGATTLTLSNGVKVIIKKTDFKADEIRMKGVSLGGSSVFPDSEIININGLDAVGVGGLGNFSAVNLEKVLAGKKASVSYDIANKTESVSGSCSPDVYKRQLVLIGPEGDFSEEEVKKAIEKGFVPISLGKSRPVSYTHLEFIAKGHFQIGSIAIRVLSFKQEEINHDFWKHKLEVAYDMRRSIGIATNPTNNTYRLVHGAVSYTHLQHR